MERAAEEVTRLLEQWSSGDRSALDQLIPVVYRELHKIAKHYVSAQGQNPTLQTTAVIHEVYLKFAATEGHFKNRAHFFAVAAKAMRQCLVDHARGRNAAKRGGVFEIIPLDQDLNFICSRASELIRLDDALNSLAKVHPRSSEVVEMRFFAGLNVEETAGILRVSPDTVLRDWKLAKAFLHREMAQHSGPDQSASVSCARSPS
jgi:RNA polymerase sigma factor (TIGR02999 family)